MVYISSIDNQSSHPIVQIDIIYIDTNIETFSLTSIFRSKNAHISHVCFFVTLTNHPQATYRAVVVKGTIFVFQRFHPMARGINIINQLVRSSYLDVRKRISVST